MVYGRRELPKSGMTFPCFPAGMRQGELLALKWEDVELNEGVIRIRRT
jgi:integrase